MIGGGLCLLTNNRENPGGVLEIDLDQRCTPPLLDGVAPHLLLMLHAAPSHRLTLRRNQMGRLANRVPTGHSGDCHLSLRPKIWRSSVFAASNLFFRLGLKFLPALLM